MKAQVDPIRARSIAIGASAQAEHHQMVRECPFALSKLEMKQSTYYSKTFVLFSLIEAHDRDTVFGLYGPKL